MSNISSPISPLIVNDVKKQIKILAPSYLGQFLDEHSKIFGNL